MTSTLEGKRLLLLVSILCGVLVIDLAAASTVLLTRRDAPTMPEFVRADLTDLVAGVALYEPPASIFGFTTDPPEPAEVDDSGRVTYREKYRYPFLNASYAIASLERYRRTSDVRWLRRAEVAVDQALDSARGGLLPHTFADTDPFEVQLPVPDYTARAQGLMLSALSRLYTVTKDQRWRDAADEVFAPLMLFRGFFAGAAAAPDPWLSVVDADGYLWFERYTHSTAPIGELEGQIWTILGLYDYQDKLADTAEERRLARALLAGGIATTRRYLPETRVPHQVSVTSIAAQAHDPNQHRVVQAQLLTLAHITGEALFERYARLFQKDIQIPSFHRDGVQIRDALVKPYAPPARALDFTTTPEAPADVSSSGQITYRDGAVFPALNATYALAALATYERTGEQRWLSRAETAVAQVLDTARNGLLPYAFPDKNLFDQELPVPYYSAEAQGLVLSALVRLHEVTNEMRWRKPADAIFKRLLRFRGYAADGLEPPKIWFGLVDDSGFLWFEHYPQGAVPSLTVAVHLSTVLGIYDYWRMTQSPRARVLFTGGVATLQAYLPIIRRPGQVSRLSIQSDDGNLRLHHMVQGQIEILARIVGETELQGAARGLRRDARDVRDGS
ncbi:MAG: hypothetical protein H0V23_07470 [Nocardioidaceae bacterium]|nr:hypothetical protein [Nocardioidaceae bacterium]